VDKSQEKANQSPCLREPVCVTRQAGLFRQATTNHSCLRVRRDRQVFTPLAV